MTLVCYPSPAGGGWRRATARRRVGFCMRHALPRPDCVRFTHAIDPPRKRGGIRKQSRHASSPAFFDRPRAGRSPISHSQPAPQERGRAERRGPYDPAGLCTVLQQEVHRVSTECRFPRRPARSVLGLLRSAPGGRTLLSTAAGLRLRHRGDFPIGRLSRPLVSSSLRRADASIPLAQAPLSQWRAAGAPGTSGLDRREGKTAPHLRRPVPATAPRPASEDAAQRAKCRAANGRRR